MNVDTVVKFSEFDQFYDEYLPLTPYGLANKYRYRVFTDASYLELTYASIEMVVAFIREFPFEADKIESYFRKISLLNNLDKSTFDTSDLFLIKKFLIHFKAISHLMDNETGKDLKIKFSLQKLLDLLSPDGETNLVFYLNSSYNPQLKSVREKINAIDKKIAALKEERLSEIAGLYGLDFNHRDFLVVNEVKAANYSNDLLYKEVFDHTSLLVKPIFPASYFELYREKDELLEEEHGLQQKILTYLSGEVHKNKVKIEEDIQTIELLDVLFAKARLAIKYLMVKPDLDNTSGCISILKGRFLPLLNKCRELGTEYIPLSVSFDSKTVVISGSNMGGKTVLLKSLGFFQLLAQMGFWVPADSFNTSIFERIIYIGNDENQTITGLSSFGFEIHQLSDVFSQLANPSFLLIDELARTTNSTEAKSLISAVLRCFAGKETVNCFLSTHIMGFPEFKEVSFYKMKGFNHDEYKKTDVNHQQQTLNERIRLINSFMQFEVVKENQAEKSYDAIMVAELLGLDKELIDHAKNYLEGYYG